MGMFDLFGGDEEAKKREMRENIERIREKVQSQGAAPDKSGMRQPPGLDEREQGQGADQGQQQSRQPSRGREQDRGQQPQQGTQQSRDSGQAQRRQQQPRGQQQQSRQPAGSHQQGQGGGQQPRGQDSRQDRSPAGDTSVSKSEVPEPPQVRELNIPDIQKGPLFITVEKFRDALRTLSELNQLSMEMESAVGSLESTLAEDQEIREQIEERLEASEERTDGVQDIVSP